MGWKYQGIRNSSRVFLAAATLAYANVANAQQLDPNAQLSLAGNAENSVLAASSSVPPDMVSVPVVQGQFEPDTAPLVQNWSIENARALIAAIQLTGSEGLNPEDYDALGLQLLVAQGPSAELDTAASESFVRLVEDLRDGRTPTEAREQWFVRDPDHVRFATGEIMERALQTGEIPGVLAELHPTHPDYALLRAALAETSEEEVERRKLIRANMDRWRWLPRDLGGQYLIANVPQYELRLMVNQQTISTYRTIVGKPGRTATPQLAETVVGVIFNPTWTVPQSIVVGEGLGRKVLDNPKWARSQGYKATVSASGRITVVQQPGPANSLGRMKLDMPNEHSIFLHDTPSRHLFDSEQRARSHGCIRVERALELGITMAILGKGAGKEEVIEIATSGEYTKVALSKQVPVYVTYFTMAGDGNGELASFDDLYERDVPVLASLD
ncbi:MAG TPA: L,D-transpeptidase [Erythrobacter sp.]|mgnify:CR=1 FL=1|nr:L,D-transpeptidase [Erythrobacter sp.]